MSRTVEIPKRHREAVGALVSGRGRSADVDTETERSPADLMTDGRVDANKIRKIQSIPAGGLQTDRVTDQECHRIRELLASADRVADVATEVGRGRTTVRKHAQGRCTHEIATPPVTFDADADEWRVADE